MNCAFWCSATETVSSVAAEGCEHCISHRSALIGHYRVTPGEEAAEQVARAYQIAPEAMPAAIGYYRRHQAAVDARLAALAPV